jgi:hypothetical protein
MDCINENYFKDIKKGDTFTGLKMTFYDGIGTTKTAMDLTDVSISIPFKKGVGQNKTFSFETENNTITIPDPLTGEIFLQPRDMNYQAATYIFDVEVTTLGGVKKTYFTNYWKICQDV